MNILFYYPDNERGDCLSSLMIAFQKQGHQVFLVTHAEEGYLHREVKKEKILTFSHVIPKTNSFVFYLKHILFLISFIKKYKIEIVYSHIQQADFISSITQYFTSPRFIITRHHTDCAFIDYNFNERTMDRIINVLGKEFIASSQKVYDQMVNVEHVTKNKVQTIPLAYDFDRIPKPDHNAVERIKEKYKTKVLLIQAARLIPEKRHDILFHAVKELVKNKFDIKLIVLGEGNQRKRLEEFIEKNQLQNHIFMLGYRLDMANFIAAADVLVHTSISEASNSTVKEAAILEKLVIACRDVGDFDEYIINNENGILVSKENTEPELLVVLKKIYNREIDMSLFGKNLRKKVLQLFSVQNIIHRYAEFHREKYKKSTTTV